MSAAPKAGEEKVTAKMLAGLTDAEKKEFSAWCSPYQPDGTEFGVKGVERASGGGTKFVDKEELAKQNGVVADVLKSVGGNIMSGISVINVSLPVRIFEPRSYLERITDVWCYAPIFLRRAALAKDPIERMKWVITFVVSGLHRGVKQVKPFNPILGETWQSEYRDGTRLYLEQLAHHPPITGYEVIGPNNMYYFHGHHEYTASFRPAGITGGQKGDNIVEFPDGTRIVFPAPMIFMTGLLGLYGDRCFQWIDFKGQPLNFVDAKNNLKCDLKFNPDQISGLSSLVYTQKTPSDRVRGFITHNVPKDPKHPPHLSEVDGSWLDDIKFDGIPYWTHGQLQPFFPIEMRGTAPAAAAAAPAAAAPAAAGAEKAAPAAGAGAGAANGNGTPVRAAVNPEAALPHAPPCTDAVLPSDSRHRADLIALKKALANGSPKPEMDAAQKLKETLEVLQRKDRKLRKDLAKVPHSAAHKKKH